MDAEPCPKEALALLTLASEVLLCRYGLRELSCAARFFFIPRVPLPLSTFEPDILSYCFYSIYWYVLLL